MKRVVVVGLVSALVSGCAAINHRPLDTKSATAWKGESITYVHRDMPDFGAMTAGKAMFGLIGGIAMISAGNSLVAEHKVPDPAEDIAKQLAASLGNQYGLTPLDQALDKSKDAKPADAAMAPRFAVDVETLQWGFAYFPTNWVRYRVLYTARAKVIDLKTQEVVAEGACRSVPEFSEAAPDYDELTGNSAARLKQELAAAAKACVGTLTAEMLASRS